MTFSVEQTGTSITARIDGDTLRIAFAAVGEARLTVTATAAGAQAKGTLDVSVKALPVVLEVPSALPSLALQVGAPPLALTLTSLVHATPAATVLRYTATSANGNATALVRGDSLIVTPVQAGTATITLTATAPEGQVARVTLTGTVTAPDCPDPAPPGFVDMLPLRAGDVWRFSLASEQRSVTTGASYTRQSGTLTLSLLSVACTTNQTRTVTALEERTGFATSFNLYTNQTDTTVLATRKQVTLVETNAGVQLPWASGTVARYAPAIETSVTVSAGSYLGCHTFPTGTARLTREGIQMYEVSCSQTSLSGRFHLERLR